MIDAGLVYMGCFIALIIGYALGHWIREKRRER